MKISRYSTIMFLICWTISAAGCKSSKSNEQATGIGNNAVQKIAQADSIRDSKNGSIGFVGIHSHGQDLAVHAHQDIGRQRRILKEAVRIQDSRESAYQKELERRHEILVQKGYFSKDSSDQSTID